MAQRVASGSGGRLNRRFLLVAILLAGLSAALVYARISATDSGSSGSGTAGGGNVPVVVASIAIQERTLITEDMLEVKNVPSSAAALGAFSNIEDVVGSVTKFPLSVNQQVLSSAVVDTSRPVGDAALANVVPTGMRAFAIRADQVLAAGGLLLPGDYVDIIWTCCPNGLEWASNEPGKTLSTSAIILTRPVLQNIQLAAVAQSIVPSGPVGEGTGSEDGTPSNPVAAEQPARQPDAATLTLLVTPEQAGVLLMAEQTGSLRAALRNPGDTAIIPDAESVEFVTPGLLPDEVMELIKRTFTTTQ